ncbi:periplasmic heavy metal sensor [Sagittula salina]|uniref:Periplasmic heavy metal sensor n=1 Tax=Sagittula salina TaxID=2820268 RepID=A0A940MM49_9RHOB|nr:periplasmic heavy metal sensor [Sagittula salina]MBP0484031.1 periplasmic heavy metal sensor [Sagittula salina]
MALGDDGRTAPRAGKGLRIVLFASLALNLAVAGAVAGFFVMGPPPPPRDRPGGADPALPYTRALTEDQRRALRREWRGAVFRDPEEARGVRSGVLADYREALEILRAAPFDGARLEALMAEQAERGAAARARGQALLSDYVARMDPEDRAAYADRLEESLLRLQRRRDRDAGPPPRPAD